MSNINFGRYKIYGKTSVTVGDFNTLVGLVQRITLGDGPNYRVTSTPCGTTLSIAPSDRNSGENPPFTVTTSTTDGTTTANVSAGTVNNLLPSNNFSSFTIDPTEVIQVKAHALTDGKAVTSCTLVVDDAAPAIQEPRPSGLPTVVDVLIAVIVGGVVYRVIGDGSIQLTGTQQFVINPSTPAQPGTLNYIPYYAWTVGVV